MTLEEQWRQKSDQELEFASRELTDYTEEAQQVIRAEMQRRSMPELPPTRQTVTQRNPDLLGNLLERLESHNLSKGILGLIWWIVATSIFLILGVLILAYGNHSFLNLVVGIAISGVGLCSIYNAIKSRNYYFLLYERGIVYKRLNGQLYAYYNELQVWQKSRYKQFFFISVEMSCAYTLKFPDGELVHITKDIADRLQILVTQHQLPQALAAYNRGETVEFGPIRLYEKGIIVYGQGIVWSRISHIEVSKGKIYIKEGRFNALRIPVAEVPNVRVLLNLFQQLGHKTLSKESVDWIGFKDMLGKHLW
ncbi:hypothetical protein NIES4075_68880 [Tolypothrix sp. NIES-4075]|uniref:DUF6585 family protein n=1 Tax=Tolypothrix sp. NIES-4075 TaxID=2005459 RepID=UPI000B5CE7D8|nr:DUF6585 family protein [Tolypothrix sp. NIES-4075]GAX45867.1 hypothetical protein NIES4075_68880 [Tolypothrix sp. NIES-4075]